MLDLITAETCEMNYTKAQINATLAKWNLDFHVEKRPSFYRNDEGEEFISKQFSLVRTDNYSELGSAKAEYAVIQNWEVYSILKQIAGVEGAEIKKAGCFKNGAQIYFFLEYPELKQLGKEKIQRYIYAISSHDKTKALALGISNMVLSCRNQFNRFYKNSDLKITHSQGAVLGIQNMAAKIIQHHDEEQKMYDNLTKWMDIPVNKDFKGEFLDQLFKADLDQLGSISTRKRNLVEGLEMGILHETKSSEKGNNVFGLFNGVTYYNQHLRKATSDEKRLESIYNGTGYTQNNAAYDILEKMVLAY